MKEFLFNPMVEEKKKRDLMKSLADDAGLSKHTLNFMNLLLDQGRLFSIAEIFDQFEIQYCKLTDTQARAAASAGPRLASHVVTAASGCHARCHRGLSATCPVLNWPACSSYDYLCGVPTYRC